MNKKFIMLPLLAATMVGCSTIDQMNALVNSSTDSINANREAVEGTTQVIRQNRQLIDQSTDAVKENRSHLEKELKKG